MKILNKIKDKLEGLEGIHAKYPSAEWNTFSWSYCLVQDLLFWADHCKTPADFLNRMFLKYKIFKDRFSYHGDASRKIYLFKLLLENKKSKKVIIPEVGPCGFDVLACKMAGYEEIHAFDISSAFVKICREIWGDSGMEYSVLDSNEIESIPNIKEFDLIVPDWWHGSDPETKPDLSRLNRIAYTPKASFFSHHQKLSVQDFFNFYEKLNQLGS